jgi:RND family efflux transporter MFP subunit
MKALGPVFAAATPDRPAPSRVDVRLARRLGVAGAVIVVAFLAGLVPRLRQRAALARETRERALPTVVVVSPAAGGQGAGLQLPASLEPWIEAPIYARASGYLRRRLVDIGARVTAGQVLAEIETPELDHELERARHELVAEQAALELARVTAERYAALVRTASATEEENTEKQADFALKTATVAAAQAEIRRLESLRAFARVTAPFAGTITERSTEVGDLIAASGGRVLFRLARTDRLRVTVRVPQAEALRIVRGEPAEVLVPELPGRILPATVANTAGAISSDSRTLLVELAVDNARGEVLAGSYAQVRFPGSGRLTPRLVLPASTLLFGSEGPRVAVVRPAGTVELRAVTLGRDFGQTVEILAGVTPADRVVLNPLESFADGDSVRVAGGSGSPAPRPEDRR